MKPYYQDNHVTIYHGDCREILPTLPKPDLVLADPPYGINHPCNFKERRRCRLANSKDYPDVFADGEPFDPEFLLDFNCILWGGNYYSSKLPDVSGWLVWDKERPDNLDQATCELAWTNCIKGVRRFRYLWNGMMRHGNDVLEHPTQKPVELMQWCLSLRWTKDMNLIYDPFMGSGPVLRAAKDLGRKAVGIEIEERYCEVAARKCAQEVLF